MGRLKILLILKNIVEKKNYVNWHWILLYYYILYIMLFFLNLFPILLGDVQIVCCHIKSVDTKLIHVPLGFVKGTDQNNLHCKHSKIDLLRLIKKIRSAKIKFKIARFALSSFVKSMTNFLWLFVSLSLSISLQGKSRVTVAVKAMIWGMKWIWLAVYRDVTF